MKSGEEKIFAESEYEICVLCGKPTGILRSVPVQSRADYVEGGGQLCPECARKVHRSMKNSAHTDKAK